MVTSTLPKASTPRKRKVKKQVPEKPLEKEGRPAPKIPPDMLSKALARTSKQVYSQVKFRNVFNNLWEYGLGQFDGPAIVFKYVKAQSPIYKTDPFGTRYCSGFMGSVRKVLALYIPEGARVTVSNVRGTWQSMTVGKCRASEVFVIGIVSPTGKLQKTKPDVPLVSSQDPTFVYTVGEWVKPRKAFDTSALACTSGIHFYMTHGAARYNH